MIKILTSIAASLIALSANAFQDWRFNEVKNRDTVVGYVYHTEAIGTQEGSYPSKVSASLRLVCSSDSNPIIVIYWDTSNRYESVFLSTNMGESLRWLHDGKVIYRNLLDSPNIVQALKTGRTIKFRWTASDFTVKTVMFSLYSINFAEFNAKCRTQF